MSKNVSFTCAAAVLLWTTLPAAAAPPAPSWYVAPEAAYMWTDRDRLADDNFGGMLAIGRSLDKWDFELSASQVSFDALGNSNLDVNSYFANAHRVFYRDSRISPFIKIGAGWVDAGYHGGAMSGESFKSWTLAYGLGLLANLTQNESLGTALALRAEVYGLVSSGTSPPNGDHLSDTVVGIGLQYHWGAPVARPVVAAPPPPPPAAPPPPPPVVAAPVISDSDGDGVPDNVDLCPNTPAGERVDEVGCPYKLRLSVFFDTDSSTISPESYPDLDLAVSLLRRNELVRGTIEGHTDSVGAEAYNLKLSQRRAAAVRQYLVDHGISASRLESVGYGESRPEADNSTPEGRAQNRRVVLIRTDR